MTSGEAGKPLYIHATALVLGEHGILIRGVSGAGKSSLAYGLIMQFTAEGGFAKLIGDDRVGVEAKAGQLTARPHPVIAGLIERRGIGLIPMPFLEEGVLHLVLDLETNQDHLPEQETTQTTIAEVVLPRLMLPQRCNAAWVMPLLMRHFS